MLLDRPGGGTFELTDHHWPRQTYLDVLSDAGFAQLSTRESLLGDDATEDAAPPPEAVHPPLLVVTGTKPAGR